MYSTQYAREFATTARCGGIETARASYARWKKTLAKFDDLAAKARRAGITTPVSTFTETPRRTLTAQQAQAQLDRLAAKLAGPAVQPKVRRLAGQQVRL